MEKEEKEDCEDAQVPKSRKYSRTLFLGNIPQSSTSASPFSYVWSQPSCSVWYVLDVEDQVLEQEDPTPNFVMLEEMDPSYLILVGISLVWKEEERLDLHFLPLRSLNQRYRWKERQALSQQEWVLGLFHPSYEHSIVFLVHLIVSPVLFHSRNHQAPMDMVVNLLLMMKKRNFDMRFMGLMTWFWWWIGFNWEIKVWKMIWGILVTEMWFGGD